MQDKNKRAWYADKVATINAEDKLTIYISEDVNRLFKILHNEYLKEERSGIGKVEMVNGQQTLTDIYFPEQTNTGGDTEFTSKGAEEMIEYIFDNDPVDCDKRNCWIHSHHSMGCFWSHTDAQQQIDFNNGLRSKMYSIVTSRGDGKIDYKGRLNIYKPIEFQLDISVKSVDDNYNIQDVFYGKIKEDYISELERNGEEYMNKLRSLPTQTRYDMQGKQGLIGSDDEELFDIIINEYVEFNKAILESEKMSIDNDTKNKYFSMVCSLGYIGEKISQLKDAIVIDTKEKNIIYDNSYYGFDNIEKVNEITLDGYDLSTAYCTQNGERCIFNADIGAWRILSENEYIELILQHNTNNDGAANEIQESDLNI